MELTLDTSKWSKTKKTYDLAYIKGKYRLSDNDAVGVILKYLKRGVHYGEDGLYKIGLIQIGREINRKHKNIVNAKETDDSIKSVVGSVAVCGSEIVTMDFVASPCDPMDNTNIAIGNSEDNSVLHDNGNTEANTVEMDLEDIFSKKEECIVYDKPSEQAKEEKEEGISAPIIEFNKEGKVLETLQVCLSKPPNKRRIWVKRPNDQHGVKLVCNVSEVNYHGLKAGTDIVCEKIEDGLYVYPPID